MQVWRRSAGSACRTAKQRAHWNTGLGGTRCHRGALKGHVGRGARLYRTLGMTRFCHSTSRMVGTIEVISFWPRLRRSQYHSLYSRFPGPCPPPQMATVICATAPARAKRGSRDSASGVRGGTLP